MAVDILMPALSPTMETGTLAKWTVAVGDPVRSGDVIAEIETDKATMEVEAVDDGILASIMVAEGTEGVAVGTPIGRLAEDGESLDDVAAAPATTPVSAPEAPAASAPAAEPEATPAAPREAASSLSPSPAAVPAACRCAFLPYLRHTAGAPDCG